MRRLPRRLRLERLESRSLLAATVGIPDRVLDPAASDPQVATSIEIDNAAGLRAATVEIHYDPALLQVDLASIRAGSIWDGKGMAIANHNDQTGTITAFVFATQHLSLSSGSLLDLDFVFNDDSRQEARASIALASLRLNEGDIPISADPIQSQAAIDGSIRRQPLPDTPPTLPAPPPTSSSPNQHLPQADRFSPAVPASAGPTAEVLPPPPVQATEDQPGHPERSIPAPQVAQQHPLVCTPWPRRSRSVGPLLLPDPAVHSSGTDEAPLSTSLTGPRPDAGAPDPLQADSAGNAAAAMVTAGLAPTVPASPLAIPATGTPDADQRFMPAAPAPVSLPPPTPSRRTGFAAPSVRLFAGRQAQRPEGVLSDADHPSVEA